VQSLRTAYANDDNLIPGGYLPSIANWVAAAGYAFFDGSMSVQKDGTYLSLGLNPLVVRTGKMTPIHGCRYCGKSDETTRSWGTLQTHVASLLAVRTSEPQFHNSNEVAA
jgi:hypothetical protein